MALVAAVLTLGVAALATGAAHRLELQTVDLRFEVRGERAAPPDVVVVAVDDRTFSDLRLQWPFPRSVHAAMVDRLRAAGARVIAYDVQFTEATVPEEDDALIGAVGRAGNVVLATTEVGRDGRHAIFGGEDVLHDIGARAGNALMPTDPGRVIRRLPRRVQGMASFATAAADQAPGGGALRAESREEEAWIDFPGGPGSVETYSFSDVLERRVPEAALRGRIAVVGATAPSLQDVSATSTSGEGVMSGPEIQAAAIDTLQRGAPLRSAGWPWELVLVLALGLVAPVAALRLAPMRAMGMTAGVGILYVGALILAFRRGLILPAVVPLATLGLAAVATLAVDNLVAMFERERLREAFGRFVPASIVDSVLARAETADGWLVGERREVTVLFSDLRGFTSFSERRPPDMVLDLLNGYLGEMSDAIMSHGGTVTSYIGDGIMAVFGAPLEQRDHADRAVAAARSMFERLEHFNERMRAEGSDTHFRMGVGLNSGPVMAGNIGSERRLEYTAIGDTVNTASRLESMTKDSGYDVFVADSTRRDLQRDAGDLEFAADLPVRGRTERVRVWGLALTRRDPATGAGDAPAAAAAGPGGNGHEAASAREGLPPAPRPRTPVSP
jgi:adenylate cyclase